MGNPIADKVSLNALVEGFSTYAKTTGGILRHPFKFPDSLEIDGAKAFSNALSFFVYTVALVFFLLVPVFSRYTAEVSKVTFLIRYLIQWGMYALLLHAALRFIGRTKRDLRGTFVTYSYLGGFGMLLFVILAYPIFLSFGPVAIFGTPEDIIRLTSQFQEHPGLRLYQMVLAVAFGIFALLISVSWFSRTHKVSRARVLLSYFLCGLVGGLIQIFILNPVFVPAFKLVDAWLKYT